MGRCLWQEAYRKKSLQLLKPVLPCLYSLSKTNSIQKYLIAFVQLQVQEIGLGYKLSQLFFSIQPILKQKIKKLIIIIYKLKNIHVYY